MKYDLHIHSKYSGDSILEPEDIVKLAIKRGLGGVAITDHNTIKGGMKAKQFETGDFDVIVGSEILTDKGEVMGLFLSDEIPPGSMHDVVADIRGQDGIVVIPHPFDEFRKNALFPAEEDVSLIDAVEGFNSRCLVHSRNEQAVEFAAQHNLSITAGSDAHLAREIGKAGIIIDSEEPREAIIRNNVRIFGKRTSILNQAGTKAIKLWRKIKQ
ncbi:MAG TPA: PHP domain-containing protein [Candidatus Methanoperedenaceae archaeon]|nr:PHP domain-containing protein [Candidatus Methanoperedenaceae archaeon]